MKRKIHHKAVWQDLSVAVLAALLGVTSVAAQVRTAKHNAPAASAAKSAAGSDDVEKFENIKSIADPAEKIDELKKFVDSNKKSPLRHAALELLVQTRIEFGDEQVNYGTPSEGFKQFRLAIADAPRPMSAELFDKYVGKLPISLFFRGERDLALELARQIESKVSGDAAQMSGLAAFYLATEDSANALRLTEAAVKLDDTSAKSFETLATAQRIAFRLKDAEASMTRALQIAPDSVAAKRGLADIKRALGKYDESLALYRSVPEAEANTATRTGIVLSLYGAEKYSEAEAELNKLFAGNTPSVNVLTGAALFLAQSGNANKSLELADRAVSLEPRFVWAHIARARALSALGRWFEAEKTLLGARQFGNFPTLDYELAKVRFAAGFYREAAETLRPVFSAADGKVRTRLGNRVENSADDFTSLLAAESRASIFQNPSANTADDERLKQLLIFTEAVEAENPDAFKAAESAKKFADGGDDFEPHRALFAAKRLLDKNIALSAAEELAQTATKNIERSVEVSTASSAVIADELYAPRREAAARGTYLDASAVPRPVLSAIMRGRVEETAGWSLFQQGKIAEAVVRLRRAVGILPENSTWWRSSLWRLGTALYAKDQAEEALEYYIRSFQGDGDAGKRTVIESVYSKLNNGSLEGLENRLKNVQNLPRTSATVNPDVRKILTAEKINSAPETPRPVETAAPGNAENTAQNIEQNASQTAAQALPTVEKAAETPIGSPQTTAVESNAAADSASNADDTKNSVESGSAKNAANAPKLVVKNEPFRLPQPKDAKADDAAKKNSADAPNEAPRRENRIIIGQAPPIENPVVVSTNYQSAEATQNVQTSLTEPTNEQPKTENNSAAQEPKPASAKENTELIRDQNVQNLNRRPRVVVTSNLPSKTTNRMIAPNPSLRSGVQNGAQTCRIQPSTKEILLSSDGGFATLSVDIEDVAGADKLEALTEDYQFIDIQKDGNFGKTSNGIRYVFIIKSLTQDAGDYKVSLVSPCGEGEISVKVRRVVQ